ncbi:MAG: hypothetical protein U0269_18450 [Polyangiales bacterium]
MHRLSLFALCLALSACGDESFFAQISGGTGPNQCSNATQTRATITGVELSEADAFNGMARPFTALNDGDTLQVVRGFQGADMIVISLRVTGLAMPACIAQRTEVLDASNSRVSINGQSIQFDPDAGVATNERMFFPGNYVSNSMITIRSTVANVTVSRTVRVVRP